MTLVSTLLFSLAWGAVVWLVMFTAQQGGLARLCSPGIYLTSILTVLLPCIPVIAGWTIQMPQSRGDVFSDAGTGQEILEFTASMGRLVKEPVSSGPDWAVLLILSVYTAGLVFHLLRILNGASRLAFVLRTARPLDCNTQGLRVLVTTHSLEPFAVGGRRACVVLPDRMVRCWPEARIAMVVAHEKAHLRHRDPDVAFAVSLVTALFWFNPFLRGLVAGWRRSCELRADADVLWNASAAARKFYAQALLEAMRMAAGSAENPLSPSFSHRSIRNDKMRMNAIVKGFEFAVRRPLNLFAYCAVWSLVVVGSAAAVTTADDTVQTLNSIVPGGRVTSPFGIERKNLRVHTGIDIAAEKRTPIKAPSDALVVQATDLFRGEPKWGKAVVLQFEGDVVAWFTHLDGYMVKPGDIVSKGEIFATVGNTGRSTGPHVHIEVYKGSERVDPATVWPFMKTSKVWPFTPER